MIRASASVRVRRFSPRDAQSTRPWECPGRMERFGTGQGSWTYGELPWEGMELAKLFRGGISRRLRLSDWASGSHISKSGSSISNDTSRSLNPLAAFLCPLYPSFCSGTCTLTCPEGSGNATL